MTKADVEVAALFAALFLGVVLTAPMFLGLYLLWLSQQ